MVNEATPPLGVVIRQIITEVQEETLALVAVHLQSKLIPQVNYPLLLVSLHLKFGSLYNLLRLLVSFF